MKSVVGFIVIAIAAVFVALVGFNYAVITMLKPDAATIPTVGECELRGTYALKVMEARQRGVSVQELYAIAGDDFTRSMILHAYRRPQFGSEEFQRKEVAEFSNVWYTQCLEQLP